MIKINSHETVTENFAEFYRKFDCFEDSNLVEQESSKSVKSALNVFFFLQFIVTVLKATKHCLTG